MLSGRDVLAPHARSVSAHRYAANRTFAHIDRDHRGIAIVIVDGEHHHERADTRARSFVIFSIESAEHRRRNAEARERPSMRRCASTTASTLRVARLWMISDSAVHAFIAGPSLRHPVDISDDDAINGDRRCGA
jgi:hypothetical protein